MPHRRPPRHHALPAAHEAEDPLAGLPAAEAAALQWLVRRADGLDAASEAVFNAWRQADPAHQAAYDALATTWQAMDEIPAVEIDRLQTHLAPATRRARRGWRLPRALVAGVAVVLLGGWFAWHQWQQPVFSQHYATTRGQQIQAALPDGSRLQLDSTSEADVRLYRQRREVRLPEGQALFTVQADAGRPFDVLAGPMRITVVGTRFSVRYTPSLGDGQVRVAVEQGRVRVARAVDGTAADTLELTAGQTVAADRLGHLGPVGQVRAEGIAPWSDKRISFDNTPLATVLAELERYGSTGVQVRDPAVGALAVTGSVDLQRIHNFIRSLPQVLPVQLRLQNGVTEIVPLQR
ncbi:FecR domain-containing protein [Xylophilus sp. GW821-FHT01B05]